MPKIHPTAIVDASAELADDVEIGPFSIIESGATLGAGCVVGEHAIIRSGTRMGRDNFVDAGCVIGGTPQDLKWDPATDSGVLIGDDNTFREGVTISRGSKNGSATKVGNRNYWMACSHAGHDAIVEDDVIFANGALVAGHATIGRRVFLSGNAVVHQFTWVGEGVMTQGGSGISAHTPPYVMLAEINNIVGMNAIGLRRNPDLSDDDRRQIKEAFRLMYRSKLSTTEALARMDRQDWGEPATRFREFIRRAVEAQPPYKRGLSTMRGRPR
jgi:UDP-N-acetylglucosamine acyltransferase